MVQHRTSSCPAVKQQMRSRALYPAFTILGIIDLLFSSLPSSSLSNQAEQGMISPGALVSIHSLIFLSHLFFLLIKSSLPRLTKYTKGLAVMKRWPLRISIQLLVHVPLRTQMFLSSRVLTLSRISFSSFASFTLVLLSAFSRSPILFSTYQRSLRTNSVQIVSMSRKGSTEFSTCAMSSSSKARTT